MVTGTSISLAGRGPEAPEQVTGGNAGFVDDCATGCTHEKQTCSNRWTTCVEKIKAPPLRCLDLITQHAARHPRAYIIFTLLFSLPIFVVGLLTNFQTDTSESLWTPFGSKVVEHAKWIQEDSGFPRQSRPFRIIIHANGNNVLGKEGVSRVFDAVDTVRSIQGYDSFCRLGIEGKGCPLSAVTAFWNNSRFGFESDVASDEDVIERISGNTYPDGTPVKREKILGNSRPRFEGDFTKNLSATLTSAQSFLVDISFPPDDEAAESFEKRALDTVLNRRREWVTEMGNPFQLETIAARSLQDGFYEAIQADLPLIPVIFIVMTVFCCIFFARCHKVVSHSLLGFGAVVNVLLSIMTAYGILFLCGIPFTLLTQILPFILFGIGLDDAFIITGAFRRTNGEDSVTDRIADTIHDVGYSIFLTKLTTLVAFALGCVSTIPAVRYLCAYAILCIFFDLVYQMTFFIALVVIDEQRIKDKRIDCLVCFKATESLDVNDQWQEQNSRHFVEKAMACYSTFILKPSVKVVAVIFFLCLLGLLAFSASHLTQAFDWTDVIPDGSYIQTYAQAFTDYTEGYDFWIGVYFRDPKNDGRINFSDQLVQEQMHKYVNDLQEMKWISGPPPFFWLDDFESFSKEDDTAFEEQIAAFLEDPVYFSLYNNDIVLNGTGHIVASRTWMAMDQVDTQSVQDQIAVFRNQDRLTSEQPINRGLDTWSFFNLLSPQYYIWGFYSVAVQELTIATVCAVAAVVLISILFIPHWSAVLFVTPTLACIYVELLGVVQLAGLHINSVTFIGVVMSIGLMVDYLMHVLIKYYEEAKVFASRDATIQRVLETIGASVLVAGITTILGAIPLAFSSSHIVYSMFVIFIGLVTLGISHGLLLLPVLLSFVGPLREVSQTEQNIAGKKGRMTAAQNEHVSDQG